MLGLAGRFGALEERPFRLLWIGQSFSAIGDALVPVALAFAVLGLTGSATDLGLVFATFTITRVVFILAGGVWADRLPRRIVMLASDVVRAAGQAFLAVIFITGTAELWHVIVAAAVIGTASAFFGPASTGLIPDTVSAPRLQQANALIDFSKSSAFIFGPVISGALVATVGAGWVFAVDAVSFVISAAFLSVLPVEKMMRAERQSFLHELARGWREVTARTWLWAALVTFSLSNLAVAAFFVLGPLVVYEELGGARDWGVMMTGSAIGGAVGSAIALRFRPRRPLVPAFLLVLPASIQLLALVRPMPLLALAAASAVTVAGIALANALWHTVLQQHVPREVLSRVSAYDWMVSLVFMPVGYAVAGPLAARIGVDTTLWLAAGLCAAVNIGILAIPAVRHLPRLGAEPAERRKPVPATAT